MKKVVVFISLSVILLSCGKSKVERVTGKVNVRIDNKSGFKLEDAKVIEVNYGAVQNGQVTEYKVIETPLYAGYCTYNINGAASFAGFGICGTPLPPSFSPGYYTFKLEPAPDGTYTILTLEKE